MNDDVSNSDFGSPVSLGGESSTIDFSTDTQISSSGSTCDAYVTYYKGRRVFVKRLKDELRWRPTNRAALKKEYDLAVQLHHKSIPFYVDYGSDYIVTDYVDGKTLRQLIDTHDPWLMKPENLRRMLRELLDAIGYLHRHNVVHCDLKDDNVMLTDKLRNVMLIDFDKAVSLPFDYAAGAAPLYGVDAEEKWSPDMDFFGIGAIVGKLAKNEFPTDDFKTFRELCQKRGVSIDELYKALGTEKSRKPWLWVAAILAVIIIAVIAIIPREKPTTEIATEPVQKDTVVIINQPAEQAPVPTPTYREQIASGMKEQVKPLLAYIAESEKLLKDSTLNYRQLSDITMTIGKMTVELLNSSYDKFAK